MTSVGETLRRERVRRNFDLERVSKELKIPPRLLEAIEAEQFEKLPGGVFAKSFVRQYARMLGLDEDELAAEVERQLREDDEPPFGANNPKEGSDIPLPRVEAWQSVGGRTSWSSGKLATFIPSAVLVVVVMLLCSAVYALWQRTHRAVPAAIARAPVSVPTANTPSGRAPVTPPVSAPRKAAPAAQPSTTQTAAKPPETKVPGTPVPAPPTPVPAAAAAATAPVGPIHIELTADEPAWVSVQVNGKYVFAGTLEAKQSHTVDAAGTVLVRLGNAGGIAVTLNGKPLGPLGIKGQVRDIQLTSGGFQFVAAPKSPATLEDPL
jgi:cytoskeleton protein RodZ